MHINSKIKHMVARIGSLTVCVISFTVLISLMFLTTPRSIGPGGVTLWFLLALVALTSLFTSMLHTRKSRKTAVDDTSVSIGWEVRTAVVLAGASVVMLAMSSLGTLALSDVLLITGATIVIEFYLYSNRRRS